MKKLKTGQYFFERLNVFEPIMHRLSTANNIESNWECIYEHVNVYTDKGNPIIAFNFCRYGRLLCYDLTTETNTTRTLLKDEHRYVQEQRVVINRQYNAFQNCLGFCVLDGQLWLNLLSQTLNQIINEDNYTETHEVSQDHLVIYYLGETPVHVSRYNLRENRYEHKIGCNAYHVDKTEDVSNLYDYSSIKRVIKNTPDSVL